MRPPYQERCKIDLMVDIFVQVIQTPRNSLNMRYLPYSAIETDAILNLDDDVKLSHKNILDAFK